MVNIIKAEHQKAKRTMRKKFIWGFPLLTFVMAFIFTLGMTNAYAESLSAILFHGFYMYEDRLPQVQE